MSAISTIEWTDATWNPVRGCTKITPGCLHCYAGTFAERLLTEEHVAVVPGGAFGPSGEGHVRACYATSEEQIREALGRIGRFVERLRV